MRKLIPILILTLIIPQITFAAWWNPTSWFREKPKFEKVLDEKEVGEILVEEAKVSNSVAEKVVEKVITVTDPKLQSQINELIRENAELKVALNQCRLDTSNVRSPNSAVIISSEFQEKKDKLAQLDKELFALIEEIADGAEEYLSTGRMIAIRDRTNEIFVAYKYIDPKFNIKDIPDFFGFMSEGGQITKKLETARVSIREAYLKLQKDLEWYIKYR